MFGEKKRYASKLLFSRSGGKWKNCLERLIISNLFFNEYCHIYKLFDSNSFSNKFQIRIDNWKNKMTRITSHELLREHNNVYYAKYLLLVIELLGSEIMKVNLSKIKTAKHYIISIDSRPDIHNLRSVFTLSLPQTRMG